MMIDKLTSNKKKITLFVGICAILNAEPILFGIVLKLSIRNAQVLSTKVETYDISRMKII